MKKVTFLASAIIILILGCSHLEFASIEYPIYKYKAPVDLVFLKTLDSLNSEDGWVLSFTEKSNGILEIKNITQFAAEETDVQRLRILVKRLDREYTSVELDKNASVCRKNTCLDILSRVNDRISKLPAHEESKTPETV